MPASADEIQGLETVTRRVLETISRVEPRLSIIPSAASSVIDDLGFDSLRLLDLTVALENEFNIAEFPMQDWYDLQTEGGGRFTVESLASACLALLAK